MSKTLDAVKALDLLHEVADGREDFVYDTEGKGGAGCSNFKNGEPSCIVGHVLAKMGLTFDLAKELKIDGSRGILSAAGVLNRESGFGWNIDPEAIKVLSRAQALQDNGNSWGDAVLGAEVLFATYK